MAANYTPPAAKSTLSNGPGAKPSDSAGVKDGLSERAGFDAEMQGPDVDYTTNGKTGNSPERVKPVSSESASKNGKSFDIC